MAEKPLRKLMVIRPLPSDHPRLALIGRVASAWTKFEHTLDETIWELAGIKRALGICITGQMMGANTRFKIIEALSRKQGLDDKYLKAVKKLKERHYGINEMRNRIVHDPWFVDLMTSVGQLKPHADTSQLKITGFEVVTETEVQATIDHIEALSRAANGIRFTTKIWRISQRGKS